MENTTRPSGKSKTGHNQLPQRKLKHKSKSIHRKVFFEETVLKIFRKFQEKTSET